MSMPTFSRRDFRHEQVFHNGDLWDQRKVLVDEAEAKGAGKWWSPSWWRAAFGGDVVGRVEQLQKQIEELRPIQTRLTKEANDLAAERIREFITSHG